MEIKAVLFDLDDTLVFTADANFLAYNQALLTFGLEFNRNDFKKTLGLDSRTFLSKQFPHLATKEIDQIRNTKKSIYGDFFHATVLNQQLIDFIDVTIKSMRIGIVTTASRRNAEGILDYHGISDRFEIIVTSDDVKLCKPHPEPYLKAIQSLGIPREQILVFEDSEIGRESAIGANLSTITISSNRNLN